MRQLIVRFVSGALAIFMIAFGFLGVIPMGEFSVVQPKRSAGFFIIGGMFALYAFKGLSFRDVLQNAKPEIKKAVTLGCAITMLVAGVGHFLFRWFADMPAAQWAALLFILIGISLSWLGLKIGR